MRRLLIFVALVLILGSAAPAAAVPGPHGPPGTWRLDFSDEFSGPPLDITKWAPSWFTPDADGFSGPVNSLEDGCYDRDNVVFYAGTVVLLSNRNSDPDCERRDGTTAAYAGAILSSNRKWAASTGVWEARIRLTGPDACEVYNWPAFWTNGQSWPENGEIDIAEGTSAGQVRWNTHQAPGGAGSSGPAFCGRGWHTYTMRRTATEACFWYDGASRGCATLNFTSPHYTIFGNQFDDDSSRNTRAGEPVVVDYFRHWVPA